MVMVSMMMSIIAQMAMMKTKDGFPISSPMAMVMGVTMRRRTSMMMETVSLT